MSLKPLLLIGLLMGSLNAVAQSSTNNPPPPPEQPHGHHGIPPEAIAACQGKTAGNTCVIKTPRGESLEGSCDAPPPGRRPPPADGNRPSMEQRPPVEPAAGNTSKPPQPPLACRPNRAAPGERDNGKR